MENSEINLQSNDSIVINDEIRGYLLETARWARFLAILGFIGLGLMVIVIIVMVLAGASFNRVANGSGLIITVFYILFAVLYYFPISYLYQFSDGIKKGVNSNDQELFTSGLKNLKSLYKFQGILTIVVISIYLLIFLFALVMML